MHGGVQGIFPDITALRPSLAPVLRARNSGTLFPDIFESTNDTHLYPLIQHRYISKRKKEQKLGHMRTDSKQRYHLASLICDYLLKKNITHADVTARDIAKFHRLSGKSSRSISAMLNFLYTNRIRETRFGFYILGTLAYKKVDYPHRYSIQLIDGARGLL
jgi:hypothetical protein